jgi:ATP-dependent Clp protease, protease subunit
MSGLALQPVSQKAEFATFSGPIDQNSLTRIFNSFNAATQQSYSEIHLLFQSTSGNVGDGICLFNYFDKFPLRLYIYNMGTIASIAVLAFLGGRFRFTNAHATFAIHKSRFPAQAPIDAKSHRALADQAMLEDHRVEAILKAKTQIPAKRWKQHALHDVVFDAQQSVQFGIAKAIGDFQPPVGSQVFNI